MTRAPFIWTSKQAIDADGFFASVRGKPERSDGLNRWFLFRRRFTLDFKPERARIDVTTDGKYQLFVNGVRLGRGPVRCSPLHQRYDTYDDASAFRAGVNVVCMLAHVYGADTAFYEAVHGHWRASFGDGALWLDGELAAGERRARLQSDLDWRAHESDAWAHDTPPVNSGLGFIESFDARRFPADWLDADFDDSGWDSVHILTAGGGGPEARFGGAVTRPFPVLKPAAMAQQEEGRAPPLRLMWAREAIVRADLPIQEQAYAEALGPLLDAAAYAGLVEGAGATLHTAEGGGLALLFDFGEIFAGRPRLELEAQGGEEIDIVVSERLPGEFDPGGAAADARIERAPLLGLDAHVTRYVARAGTQRFEAFEWDAVRYLQLMVRNAPAGLRIRALDVATTRYPAPRRGGFECSDALLTKLWALGRKTLELCMHDGWIDCPSREQRQWLGDATVEHLVGEAAFGVGIHPLNRHFLVSAAESQRPDGLLEMFAPGDHRRFGWLIPDFTLQWMFNLADHYRHSGDIALVRTLFPTMLKALSWFEALQGEDGRIADLPYWHFQDWAAVGRSGYATVLNAELRGAFLIAAELAETLGWAEEGARLRAEASRLAAALEAHWDEARGLYVDIVDPETGARQQRVSQHANAAMILWGGADDARARRIAASIGDQSRLRLTPAPPITPVGEPFDAETDIVLANTFFSHFVYAALAKAGRFDLAIALMRSRYGAMLERGATSLWEGFEPHASLAHGFSATPVFQLSRNVLGVSPAAPGFAEARIAPDLGDLHFARGVCPTLLGDIAVELTRAGDAVDVAVTLPPAMRATLAPPPGYGVDGEQNLAAGLNRRRLVPLARPARNG